MSCSSRKHLSTQNLFICFIGILALFKLDTTPVLILNGNSHVRSNLCYFICSSHLIRSRAVTHRIFLLRKDLFSIMCAKNILSYHLIYIPWMILYHSTHQALLIGYLRSIINSFHFEFSSVDIFQRKNAIIMHF